MRKHKESALTDRRSRGSGPNTDPENLAETLISMLATRSGARKIIPTRTITDTETPKDHTNVAARRFPSHEASVFPHQFFEPSEVVAVQHVAVIHSLQLFQRVQALAPRALAPQQAGTERHLVCVVRIDVGLIARDK